MMAEHGLNPPTWRFEWFPAKTMFGACRHNSVMRRVGRRQRVLHQFIEGGIIRLSSHLVALNGEEKVRATILHEIAHALAGPGHGHDAHWRAIAIRIGDSGERCYEADTETPDARFTATCSVCGKSWKQHRRPVRQGWCTCVRRNFQPQTVLVWTDSETGVSQSVWPPPPRTSRGRRRIFRI